MNFTMQRLKEQLCKGLITEEDYQNEAITRSANCLMQNNYELIKNLGNGAYGTVFEAKNEKGQSIAIKFVLQEFVNRNEIQIWPTLENENVLPLIDLKHIPQAGTFAFFMPLIPSDLGHMLEDSTFLVDINGFNLAKSYLEAVMKGTQYLHSQKLCHLDIKPGNVLISCSGNALLCDFSSLTPTEAGVDNYVSPFVYRPPEAVISKNCIKTIVNGFSYDVYTIGILALELFTNQALLKSCQNIGKETSWCEQIYPQIFRILEKKQFQNAVKKAFLTSDIDKKSIKVMRNFVKGCICLNPRIRPTMDDILQHKMFGGNRMFKAFKNDIWKKKASPEKVNFLISLFVAQASSLSLPSEFSTKLQTSKRVLRASNEENLSCDAAEQIYTDHTEAKVIPNNDGNASSSKAHSLMEWISRKKSRLYNNFNNMISALRHIRK